MGAYPAKYTKEEFRKSFLENNKVSDVIIKKFDKLPEKIIHNNCEYKLNIVCTFFSIGSTFYNFELNYYSENLIEFLFNYEIFSDIEKSIDYLLCELVNGKFIER